MSVGAAATSAEKPAEDFVHLHVHTEFSLLDGLSKIDKLVARAKELNMKSLAITDHGAMFGVIHFYRACKKADIKPIIGMEGYLARQDMHVHDITEKKPFHLLLLAKNEVGYKNLLKIASAAQLEGFYSKPRIDKDFLHEHHEGIICTSGCLAAEIPGMIVDGREDEARRTIGMYQDIFGPENFYLELQEHVIPEIKVLNQWLIQNQGFARVPLVATNDVHYVMDKDFNAHDTLLCIQTGARKSDEKRMRMTDPSYHLRSQQEMWDLFHEVPEALTNTLAIAEMCNVSLDSKGYHLPVFPVPDGYTADTYLRSLAKRGLEWRYGEHANDEVIQKRLNYELGIIHQMGFDTYFLIVWDLCQFAHAADIWWNVRGSGAGSVVAYTLGITSIDPMRNNLIFERFLNPGRVSMPDIDMDFPDDRRMEMIDYAMRKYGSDKVAAIITFGTMKSRAAIKDVGRALDYSLPEVNELTKLIPQIPSKPVTLADCLGDNPEKAVPELRERYDSDERVKVLLDTALTVEGVARNAGTHAAGIIIGDKPLVEYLPLHRPIGDTKIKQVTQFPMEICEGIGLLKVDFLGLSTLTIMRKACDLIEKYHGIKFTMRNIPYRPDPNDPEVTAKVKKAFDFIGQGETTGIFQLESAGMTRMLVEMKPQTFEHIIAAISLYRPGPMELIPTYIKRMHGEEPIVYHHELLEPILHETYGIVVYQEQIQQIAAQLFGYSLGDADLMRRAVSKKKLKDLATHKQFFMEQGPERGVSKEVAEKIFDEIEYFAAYGFNKSHAADYAVLTCQTAYLKAHFPEEYYTALLSVQRDVIEDVRLFISDCRRLGIQVLPPNVNASDVDFVIEPLENGGNDKGKISSRKRGIRYGLGAVKNAGEKAVQQIVDARMKGGRFRDISDFCRRVDLRVVGKRAIESLIKVGAFDDLGNRDQLLQSLERISKFSSDHHHAEDIGQMSLFGGESTLGDTLELATIPAGKETPRREMLKWEKELVGLYVSEHPLTTKLSAIQQISNIHFSENLRRESETMNGRMVTLVGIVIGIRTIMTKKSDMMAIVSLEDTQGNIDCVMFPRTWAQYKDVIKVDELIMVRGKADASRGDMQILAEHISQDIEVASSADEPYQYESPTDDSALYPDTAMTYAPPAEPLDWSDEASAYGPDEPMSASSEPHSGSSNEPITPPSQSRMLYGNGTSSSNGNGTANGRDSVTLSALAEYPTYVEQSDPYAEEESTEPEPALLITITIRRSEEPLQDRRRIQRIQRELNQYPGQDHYRFRVVDHVQIVTVEFSQTTHYKGAVAAFLATECGADAIETEVL